jgi:hypothetical protein
MVALGIGGGFLFMLIMVCHTILVSIAVLVLLVDHRIQQLRRRWRQNHGTPL